MTAPRIRRLNASEAALWRRLSLEAIRHHPEAFVTSYEEESALPLEHFSAQIEGGTQVFVADEDRGIGFLRIDGEACSLHGLYVHPDARGRGLGDALMEALVSAARAAGCRRIGLGVFGDNRPAIRIYERHGFSRQSSTPFGDRDSWKMVMDLG